MDLQSINQGILGVLAGMYMHGTLMFGADLLQASARKRRRFHKWLLKHYTNTIYELPEELSAHLFIDVSDREVVEFLAACYDEMERRIREQKDQERQLMARMDAETAAALETVLAWEEWLAPRQVGEYWELPVDGSAAFQRWLILENVAAEGHQEEDYLVESLRLEKADGRYILTGRIEGSDTPLTLSFTDARVRVESFDPMDAVAMEDPWHYLSRVAADILEKLRLPGDYGSGEERSLMALLEELDSLCIRRESFPILAEIARSYGLHKMARRLETKPGDPDRLIRELCGAAYEPMWRTVFEKIRDAQAGYPKAVEVLCDPARLAKERGELQSALEAMGYTGRWPLFEKQGRVDGLCLASSYDMTYFVFREKEAAFRIRCMERCEGGEPKFDLLCATAFPRKRSVPQDIYSCVFDGRGTRLFSQTVDPRWRNEPDAVTPERIATVAAKRAELRRLDKEERKWFYQANGSLLGLFLWVLLLAGGSFAVFMTAGFALIAVLMGLLFGAAREIPSMMAAMPWWQIFVFCWAAYGGAMGLLAVWVKRK